MSNKKEPIDLILYKGNKPGLTKLEIAERRENEIKVEFDDLTPPTYLLKEQKKQFTHYAQMLKQIGIMKELDVDCLARYIIAHDRYVMLDKKMRNTQTSDEMAKLSAIQDRAFNQAHKCATALGLTITSRCSLSVPEPDESVRTDEL